MPDDLSRHPGAFPELELDIAPPRAAAEDAPDEPEHALEIELAAPPVSARAISAPSSAPAIGTASAPPAAFVPSSPPLSAPNPSVPPVSARGYGPPPSMPVPSSAHVIPAAPGLAGATEPPPPSAAHALYARAKAVDAADVADRVAEVGRHRSTSIVMLAGAVVLTILDRVYVGFTGERLNLGPITLAWLAVPLAIAGALLLGRRLMRSGEE